MAPEFGSYQNQRQGRAEDGKVSYPAKRLSRMEKSVARAQKTLAHETKPLMSLPDDVVAKALEIASHK